MVGKDNHLNSLVDIDKERHELKGSLGILKLLCSHLSSQNSIDDRTLHVLEMLVALLERIFELKGRSMMSRYPVVKHCFDNLANYRDNIL